MSSGGISAKFSTGENFLITGITQTGITQTGITQTGITQTVTEGILTLLKFLPSSALFFHNLLMNKSGGSCTCVNTF